MPEQKEDAARLRAAFDAWRDAQRDKGEQVSQIEAASRLEFGQSALSQYLNGKIPLNGPALLKFASLLGVEPQAISPSIAVQEAERSQTWAPTESLLESMAREMFWRRKIKAQPLRPQFSELVELMPAWLRNAAGPAFYPDLILTMPDGSHAWVEVKSPRAVTGGAMQLARLQAEHPREFLLLMAEVDEIPAVIDRWLQRRDAPPQLVAAEEPAALRRMPRWRPVWVVDHLAKLDAVLLNDDHVASIGATEFADVASDDPKAFAYRVVGDTMVPRFIPGEYALVEPGTTPDLEDDVLVRLKSNETMLARLLSRRSGLRLGSYNGAEVFNLKEDEVRSIFYVAHAIPARRIRPRSEALYASGSYSFETAVAPQGGDIDVSVRASARQVHGEGTDAPPPAPGVRRKGKRS